MPKLSELTDYQPNQRLYVSPIRDNEPVLPTTDESLDYFTKPVVPLPELSSDNVVERIIKKLAETEFSSGTDIGNKLAGTGGKERYQLWPEKVIRSALTTIPEGMAGKIPTTEVDPETGAVHTSQELIGRAMDMATFAGVGGLGGTGSGGVALGAGPSLRPALKYKDRLYKGKEGQQHMDVIPPQLYPEFQNMAMRGEDISHYNFGFVNDKGHFLSREDALKYGIDTGLVDPQAGKFGALTSTLMADSSKPGVAIEAMAKTAQPFYSAVEHTVNSIPQAKMNGEAWLGTLANKPGVKPEELDWTGLRSFLEENKGKPVTKQQVQDYIAANKVELKEVSKGTGELHKAAKEFNAEAGPKPINVTGRGQLYADEIEQGLWDGSLTPKDLPTNLQPYAEKMMSLRYQQEQPTKYHSYQLPGGENYREMLMTLPHANNAKSARMTEIEQLLQTREAGKEAERAALRDEYKKLADETRNDSTYKSSHWDEPNILAHVRMNDRTIDGKKSLHLEEIQSDWHQQGRDKGYKGDGPTAADLEKASNIAYQNLSAKLKEAQPNLDQRAIYRLADSLVEKVREGESDSFHTKQEHELAKNFVDREAAYLKHSVAAEQAKVPDAPFKKSWHELALKRMLREAAEKGYDRLSWTPGEAQAARYDLSKSIGSLKATPIVDQHGLKYEIRATNPSGTQEVLNQVHSAEELPNVVGKEMAKKIIDESEGKKPVQYKGLDLKVGGEGMKGFYDQIIPKALEKIGKEHGVKVKKGEIPKGQTYVDQFGKTKYEPAPVYYIDIPQSLKDRAMQKGFPLFSSAFPGYAFKPVDGDPFKDE